MGIPTQGLSVPGILVLRAPLPRSDRYGSCTKAHPRGALRAPDPQATLSWLPDRPGCKLRMLDLGPSQSESSACLLVDLRCRSSASRLPASVGPIVWVVCGFCLWHSESLPWLSAFVATLPSWERSGWRPNLRVRSSRRERLKGQASRRSPTTRNTVGA